jgi:hypothetical protein
MGTRYTDGGHELLSNGNVKTKLGAKSIDNNPDGAGSIPAAMASYVTATEKGDGVFRQTTLTLSAVPLTVRDTEQGGGVQIYTFPAGRIGHIGSSASLAVTTTSALASTLNASKTCQIGMGTVTQANATLATTEQDLINNTAFTSSATVDVASATVAGVGLGSLTPHDGTSTAIAGFLNVAVATAEDIDADATVTVSGTITLTYVVIDV